MGFNKMKEEPNNYGIWIIFLMYMGAFIGTIFCVIALSYFYEGHYERNQSQGIELITGAFNIELGRSLILQNTNISNLKKSALHKNSEQYSFNFNNADFDTFGLKTTIKNKLVYEVFAEKEVKNEYECNELIKNIGSIIQNKYNVTYYTFENPMGDESEHRIVSTWYQKQKTIKANCDNLDKKTIFKLSYIDNATKDKIPEEALISNMKIQNLNGI